MTDPATTSEADRATAVDLARAAMVAWLRTADARAAAGSELHRLGIAFYDTDDLLQDVAVKVLQATTAPDDPVAYARRSLRNQSIDLLRGERVHRARNTPLFADDEDGPMIQVPTGDALPSDVTAVAELEDGIRRGLSAALAGAAARTWTIAAALTTLTLRIHRDVALPNAVPRPDVDDEAKADRWAALWLAGERDVFPDAAAAQVDDAARRQARSRKLREVSRLLALLGAPAWGADADA